MRHRCLRLAEGLAQGSGELRPSHTRWLWKEAEVAQGPRGGTATALSRLQCFYKPGVDKAWYGPLGQHALLYACLHPGLANTSQEAARGHAALPRPAPAPPQTAAPDGLMRGDRSPGRRLQLRAGAVPRSRLCREAGGKRRLAPAPQLRGLSWGTRGDQAPALQRAGGTGESSPLAARVTVLQRPEGASRAPNTSSSHKPGEIKALEARQSLYPRFRATARMV